jgi:hypothetical protein
MYSVFKVQSLLTLKGCGTYSNHSELITEKNGVLAVSPVGLPQHIAASSPVVLRYSRWRTTTAVYHQYFFVNWQDWLKEGLNYVMLPAVLCISEYIRLVFYLWKFLYLFIFRFLLGRVPVNSLTVRVPVNSLTVRVPINSLTVCVPQFDAQCSGTVLPHT